MLRLFIFATTLLATASAKSAYCEACTELLSVVENKTCAELPAVCNALPSGVVRKPHCAAPLSSANAPSPSPPFSRSHALPPVQAVTICTFLFDDTNVCADVVKWLEDGATPAKACQDIGLCSGGSCKSGVCTPAVAALNTTSKYRCLSLPNSCGHNVTAAAEPAFMKVGAPHEHSGFCVDGECGPDKSLGCCLTSL